MHKIAVSIVILLATLGPGAGSVMAAAGPDPQAAHRLLTGVADDMIAELRNPAIRRDESSVSDLVNRVLVPHIDFEVTARLVLGKHWRAASAAQRAAFVQEFRGFVLRFYTTALADYVASNDVPRDIMAFQPVSAAEAERQMYVRSQVRQQNGQPVSVDYRMYWVDDTWKVVDVSVEGISMAVNYRTNFANEIRAKGIDGLIASLRERNAELASD